MDGQMRAYSSSANHRRDQRDIEDRHEERHEERRAHSPMAHDTLFGRRRKRYTIRFAPARGRAVELNGCPPIRLVIIRITGEFFSVAARRPRPASGSVVATTVCVNAALNSGTSSDRHSPRDPTRLVKHILCPVDWTPDSRRALQYAASLARTHDAQLTVLHVGELVALYPALVVRVEPAVVPSPARAERAAKVSEMLRDHTRGCRPPDVLLLEGDIPSTIVVTAARLDADLIVLASHHPGPLRRLTRGSVAAAVVGSAGCPVLVVPPGQPRRAPLMFQDILSSHEQDCLRALRLFDLRQSHTCTLNDAALRAEALGPTARITPDVAIVSSSSAVAGDLVRHAACPVLFVPTTGEQKEVRR
jgi:universal stress protein A